jgi:hypothetical protein
MSFILPESLSHWGESAQGALARRRPRMISATLQRTRMFVTLPA